MAALHMFMLVLTLEPIEQSQVGPKTSLTMKTKYKGHESHLGICDFNNKHEVYVLENTKRLFFIKYDKNIC